MKLWLLVIALCSAFALGGCGRCRSTSDCSEGERCDFDNGDCILGCTSNSDCSATTFCNLERGRCDPRQRPSLFPNEDASSEDVTTSTAADASLGERD